MVEELIWLLLLYIYSLSLLWPGLSIKKRKENISSSQIVWSLLTAGGICVRYFIQ